MACVILSFAVRTCSMFCVSFSLNDEHSFSTTVDVPSVRFQGHFKKALAKRQDCTVGNVYFCTINHIQPCSVLRLLLRAHSCRTFVVTCGSQTGKLLDVSGLGFPEEGSLVGYYYPGQIGKMEPRISALIFLRLHGR